MHLMKEEQMRIIMESLEGLFQKAVILVKKKGAPLEKYRTG